MVRNRKVVSLHPKHGGNNETSSSSGNSETSSSSKTFEALSVWKTLVGVVCLLVAVYVGTLGYFETRVNTPFDDEKVVQETGQQVPERYWGTYRPGVYFGLKTREPKSPVFGMMWYDLSGKKGIRHWCDQNDGVTYSWLRHDGVTFGEQMIVDPPYNIETTFLKNGHDHWNAKINITTKDKKPAHLMLVLYAALDESLGPSADMRLRATDSALVGHTPQLGDFKVHMMTSEGRYLHKSHTNAHAPGLHLLKEKYISLLRTEETGKFRGIAMLDQDKEVYGKGKDVNFVAIQLLVETPYSVDLVYTTNDMVPHPINGQQYTAALDKRKAAFDVEFEEKFSLKEKGYSDEDVAAAKASLSNMVGGIGYFYGAGRVISQYTQEPVPYWRAPLYTGVPSRSFFPRGFLWDEGFHAILISRWSLDIVMDIAAHWMDLINVEGWIPREQILGVEALAKVPKEFVVQNNAAANPPMLLLQLARLVRTRPALTETGSKHRRTLDRMFTRLQAWYQWFQTTQKGNEPTSYRWRGREDDGLQLNPKSLSSGIDDYPRASHPTDIERHLDLRCWMYAAADAMATVARAVNRDTSKFEAMRDQLGDEDLLNKLHWSPTTQTYADYGLHTDGVRLVRSKPKHPNEPRQMVRSVTVPPQPKLVTSAFGYVSLFPMLLKVLKPESENLGKILETLDKPELLWSPYGLRSLSKSSPLYMARNTEHDPPYWRGQVWININYLALAALKHYSITPGPHMERARVLHSQLRTNVVRNVLSEYKRTGAYWEQYSGEDGRGSGCRPFTGWTGLITLIMAEEY